MRSSFKNVLASVLISASFLGVSAGHAADIKERSLKFAFVQPKDHPWGHGAQRFADLVSEKSGKKITVKTFPGGTLGGDIQMLSSLQGGTLDMTMMAAGLLVGLKPQFVVWDLPFLFNDFKETDAVLDGPIGKKLMDTLPEKGLIGLSYWDHGFRNVTNSRRPIAKPEDIEGLKIRTLQAPIQIDIFTTLGANAVPLSFPELYAALEQKAVDGQENPLAVIEANKFYEVQKYLSLTRHTYNPLIVLVSKKTWDRLSNDERKILMDAAAETRAYQRKVSRDWEAKALETMKGKGMLVNDISPQEKARMREKLKPVTDKYSKEAGEALVKEVNAEIEKVRGGK
jgi:tripartite ATP-independent transporter DctP family solute receptor